MSVPLPGARGPRATAPLTPPEEDPQASAFCLSVSTRHALWPVLGSSGPAFVPEKSTTSLPRFRRHVPVRAEPP